MDPRELPRHFESKLDEITSSIREIVEIESPSFNAEGVTKVVDWIEARAKEVIPEVVIERVPVDGRGEHLVIRAFGSLPGNPLFVLGHTDTVHPLGSTEKNPTRIEEGRLYGCGTFDMKANIALMLEVFASMKAQELSPARPITILLACDEEVGSETGRPLVEREASGAEYCLVFEPSARGKIKTGRKGTSAYTLRARGVPAHAGLDPEKGASAVLELSKQIIAISGLNDPDSGTTVTVGTVKGGTAMNVVPENAECSIDVRFTSLERAEKVESALRRLSAEDERVELMLEGEINRPPLERTDAVVRLFEKAKGLGASFGYEISETQVGGASDGNFVGALGVPVLDGLGIEGDGAHRLDEHVVVADIPNRASLMTLLLANDLSDD